MRVTNLSDVTRLTAKNERYLCPNHELLKRVKKRTAVVSANVANKRIINNSVRREVARPLIRIVPFCTTSEIYCAWLTLNSQNLLKNAKVEHFLYAKRIDKNYYRKGAWQQNKAANVAKTALNVNFDLVVKI